MTTQRDRDIQTGQIAGHISEERCNAFADGAAYARKAVAQRLIEIGDKFEESYEDFDRLWDSMIDLINELEAE